MPRNISKINTSKRIYLLKIYQSLILLLIKIKSEDKEIHLIEEAYHCLLIECCENPTIPNFIIDKIIIDGVLFLKIVNKFSQKIEVTNNYPIGALTLVFNNLDWVFEPINWKNK